MARNSKELKGSEVKKLTLISVLAALSVVLKFSPLKIPFPLLPYIKFDLIELPLLFAFFVLGLRLSLVGGVVMGFSIAVFNPGSAFMKFLAFTSTMLPLTFFWRNNKWLRNKYLGYLSSVLSRVAIMAVANLLITPLIHNIPVEFVLKILPFICLFNLVAASYNVLGGYWIYLAVEKRIGRISF